MMNDQPQLHSSIIAMVSLASGIAAKHPAMGQCQLKRLRQAGVPDYQIDVVVEIARHIRDEAAQKLDAAFDDCAAAAAMEPEQDKNTRVASVAESAGSCCSSTDSGQSCC